MAHVRRWSALVAGVVGGVVGAGVMAGVTGAMGHARQGAGWQAYFGPWSALGQVPGLFGRIVVPVDWDGDGDADLITASYFERGARFPLGISLLDNLDGVFIEEATLVLEDAGLPSLEADSQFEFYADDFNGDGVKELILSAYGEMYLISNALAPWQPNAPRAADLNRDGMVGSEDVALLLGAWGPVKPAEEANR